MLIHLTTTIAAMVISLDTTTAAGGTVSEHGACIKDANCSGNLVCAIYDSVPTCRVGVEFWGIG